MARWLSFLAEYNFEVNYKPGKQNALADVLSRRPDYDLAHATTVTSSIPDLIRASYASNDMCVALLKALVSKEFEDSDKNLSARLRARLHRYAFDGGLLYYSTGSDDPPRVVVPHDEDLKYRILYEAHDTPVGGHIGRENTYSSVSLHYWWPNFMDFMFGLPPDAAGNTGVVAFVDRLSKMAHLAVVPDAIDCEGTATLFLGRVFRQHGLPEAVVSDRDPHFTCKFWTSVFAVLGTCSYMSTADHPQTKGQTERVNRVVEDVLRSICAETPKRWSAMLPVVEFALDNVVHASTGYTPFYVNGLALPRVPLAPPRRGFGLRGRDLAERLADVSPYIVRRQVDECLSTRLSVLWSRARTNRWSMRMGTRCTFGFADNDIGSATSTGTGGTTFKRNGVTTSAASSPVRIIADAKPPVSGVAW
ncbi:unnamed protein product [Phytophthora fragariaefolia]|uniref:Unnamed protein product n=1 Tax=Phytophthora fragariaefolia TaxID=1490495 RepID=A0A9W6XBZ7_9STRA|nr:unnamed protein product [Phytophthora fragariaefolia]